MFSNPTNDLKLMREIGDLLSVFPTKRRPVVRPAARLADVRTPFSLRPPSAASSPIAPRRARTPTALARSSYALNAC